MLIQHPNNSFQLLLDQFIRDYEYELTDLLQHYEFPRLVRETAIPGSSKEKGMQPVLKEYGLLFQFFTEHGVNMELLTREKYGALVPILWLYGEDTRYFAEWWHFY